MRSASLGVALLFAAPVAANDKAPPRPEPATHPDWGNARQTAESGIKSQLFDPGSAQFTYSSGFQWGYTKPIIGRRRWGWVACGAVNAKNRMGGYVGAKAFVIRLDEGGAVSWIDDGDDVGTCTNGARVGLQPELRDQAAAETQAGARLGVADELSKLADLRAKGVITQEEFDAQKAKLLAR